MEPKTSLAEEFEIVADFNQWLKILPELSKLYQRVVYYDKSGFIVGFFKLKSINAN